MVTNKFDIIKRLLLALIFLLTLFPAMRYVSPRSIVENQVVFLAWLPLGLLLAVMLLFGRLAILPIFVATTLIFKLIYVLSWPLSIAFSLSMVVPIGFSAAVMYYIEGRRWRYGVFTTGLGWHLFWLCFITPLLTKILMLFVGHFFLIPENMKGYFGQGSLLFSIIDTLNLIAAALIFTPLFYYPLRMLLSRRFARAFWQECFVINFQPEYRVYTICWTAVLLGFLLLFCWPSHTVLISGYLVPIIFIFFTHGIQRLSRTFISLSWVVAAWTLLTWSNGFLYNVKTGMALSFVLSVFISFTVCLLYMMQGYQRNEKLRRVYHSQALTDPIAQLPNMRALELHMETWHSGALCCLRMGNLEFLSRHYGMMMRVHAKRMVTRELAPYLQEGEKVFQLPGSELLIFLHGGEVQERLNAMVALLNSHKIVWNNSALEMEYSASWDWMEDYQPDELQRVLGQLSYLAELATQKGTVLSLSNRQRVVEGETSGRVYLLHKVKQAIEQDLLLLYGQPIVNAQGQGYQEILARLNYHGEMIPPDKFLPIVAEFNLSVRFDMLIISKLVLWLKNHAPDASDVRFSVNLMPLTLMQKDVASDIVALFEKAGVAISSVIIEITEAQAFSESEIPMANIHYLKRKGFKIAIDDFGTGYANYARLKTLDAEIVKIDGSFVRDICTNTMDYLIVQSICQLAKARGLTVVAEYVETVQQQDMLLAMGVDYLQGYYLGAPKALEGQTNCPGG